MRKIEPFSGGGIPTLVSRASFVPLDVGGRAVGHPEGDGLDPELRLAARHRRHSVETDDRLAGSVVRGDDPPDAF